jgi:transcriptional regulator with GAF, ATPase, and Fis domain
MTTESLDQAYGSAFGQSANTTLEMDQLYQSAPIGLALLDTQLCYVRINDTLAKLHHLPAEDHIGKHITQVTHDLHPTLKESLLHILSAGEQVTNIEIDGRMSLGCPDEGRWLINLHPLLNASGALQGIHVIVQDITEHKRTATNVAERLAFETLLANLSAQFINLPTNQVDREIENAQRRVCECLGLDLSALWFEVEPGSIRLTHLYRKVEGPPTPERMDAQDYFPWCLQQEKAGKIIIISSEEDLPPEASRDREVWRHFGIKSTLSIPLAAGGGPMRGALSFDTVQKPRVWPDELVNRLQLVAQIFANALIRKSADENLLASHRKITELNTELERLNAQLERENLFLKEEFVSLNEHAEIVGQSKAIRKVFQQIQQVAPTDSHVLITGETGTGKELVARAIHATSKRNKRVLVKVNCAALPTTLIESELFGREKGAFTGALTRQIGRFEMADGGTIFLDEIGELSIELQAKLLNVLQEGNFERLGAPKTIHVDVRVIAATNRNLAEAVRKGEFRKDLYYRLSVFPIDVPPLRTRAEDIPSLVWAFIEQLGTRMGKSIKSVPKQTMERLINHSWPGNVRELRNLIEQAMILSPGERLDIQLPDDSGGSDAPVLDFKTAERHLVLDALRKADGRIKGPHGAAAMLGLKPSTLYTKMQKLGIQPNRNQDAKPS